MMICPANRSASAVVNSGSMRVGVGRGPDSAAWFRHAL